MKDGTINAPNWLNNILPAPKGEDASSTATAASRASREGSRPETPSKGGDGSSTPTSGVVATPQKPVNLLPEVPSNASRKLTEREQRDCEVIGESLSYRQGQTSL